jgi:hypothetical protein
MRKFILFFGLFLLCHVGFATHQRAGEITYKRLGGLTYEFTVITYTFTPSPADRPEIEVFWGDNSSSIISRQSKTSVGTDISKNVYVANPAWHNRNNPKNRIKLRIFLFEQRKKFFFKRGFVV